MSVWWEGFIAGGMIATIVTSIGVTLSWALVMGKRAPEFMPSGEGQAYDMGYNAGLEDGRMSA